jgi:hypothetical protein
MLLPSCAGEELQVQGFLQEFNILQNHQQILSEEIIMLQLTGNQKKRVMTLEKIQYVFPEEVDFDILIQWHMLVHLFAPCYLVPLLPCRSVFDQGRGRGGDI